MAREQPPVGYAHLLAQQLLAAVGGPARDAAAEPLRASGQQEVLHRRVDRAAEEELGRRLVAVGEEQHRRALAGAVVEIVGRSVVAGEAALDRKSTRLNYSN